MRDHPYSDLPDRSFWKRAVAQRHYEDMADLWTPPSMQGNEKFATAGSCFAQHIGRHVSERGSGHYMEVERAPLALPEHQHTRFGYGIYSCRYGNIYTSRQLLQIAEEAFGRRAMSKHVWVRDGRYFDAIRPSVDPIGQESEDLVLELRQQHLHAVRRMLLELDVMIFTLGLTETWVSQEDGTAFPSAPGVMAGSLSQNPVLFQNLSVREVDDELTAFWKLLKEVNPSARMILTVSPVPLIATASDEHVLAATTYSKSVLRVVAHDLAERDKDIHYFPSYELVNSAAGRGYYFDPDLRTVNDRGVRYVMSHFFSGDLATMFPPLGSSAMAGGVVCDEEAIETAVKD